MATLKTKLYLRNDTTANWTANATVVLGKGEVGIEWIESGAPKIKIGDGATAWSALPYYGGSFTVTGTGNTIVDASYDSATGVLTLTKGNRLTGSGLTADTILLGNGSYAVKTSSKKIEESTLTNDNSKIPTSKVVYTEIQEALKIANAAMTLVGTLGDTASGATHTSLSTASEAQLGDAYKVIKAGTYGGVAAKVGDLIVCYKPTSTTYAWILIPSGDDIEDTWRVIQLDGTQKLSTSTSSGALNLKNVAAKSISITYNSGFEFDVKTGYTTSGKNYAVAKDDNGNLYVNVPWSAGTDSRDPGYGKITPANSTAVTALTSNTTQISAGTYNENVKFSAANKWIVLAGASGSGNGNDEMKWGHSLSGVTAGSYGESANATLSSSKKSFSIPYITVDAAGHTTAASSITITLPDTAFVNTTYGIVSNTANGLAPKMTTNNSFLMRVGSATAPTWNSLVVLDGGSASTTDWGTITA